MAERKEIPENGDKMLFAEEFINFMTLQTNQSPYEPFASEPYRDLVFNGFNESVKKAARFLNRTMEEHLNDISYFMQNPKSVNYKIYLEFSNVLSEKYFSEGFNADNFLSYCVHLASVAVYFYNHGVSEALNVAVLKIFDAFPEHDMSAGCWDTLNRSVEKYASMEQDFMNTKSQKSIVTGDISENPQNVVAKQGNVYHKNGGSNDNLNKIKQTDLESNEKISSPLKCSLSEKGPTKEPKKLLDPVYKNIPESSEMLPSASGTGDSKEFNDPCCSDGQN